MFPRVLVETCAHAASAVPRTFPPFRVRPITCSARGRRSKPRFLGLEWDALGRFLPSQMMIEIQWVGMNGVRHAIFTL